MHDCDVMICVGARFDDRITGRLDAFSPGSKKIHIDIDPSSINKNVKVDLRASSATARTCSRTWCGCGAPSAAVPDKKALAAWWKQIDKWRREKVARLSQFERDHQAAIRDPAALRADQGPRHLHHHRSRPAPDVGGAVLSFPGAEPLDDLGRARHHGLRPAGLGRRAARASEFARHRHRRRGVGADDHAGNVDRGAVPTCRSRSSSSTTSTWAWCGSGRNCCTAGAIRIPIPRRCRISSSSPRPIMRVGIRCDAAGRARRRDPRDDRGEEAGDLRLRGRSDGKLLPDDPVRPRPQRDAARRRRRAASRTRSPKKAR